MKRNNNLPLTIATVLNSIAILIVIFGIERQLNVTHDVEPLRDKIQGLEREISSLENKMDSLIP